MSYDPNNQENPPEDPSTPATDDGYPAGDPGNPGNPDYPPFGGPGYPPPGNPGYPPFGGPGYPPPGNPGYAPPYPNQPYPGYNPPPPQFTPRPLGETLQQLPRQYWRVLSHPGAATFAEEQAFASWGAIWIQLIGYAVISAILTFVFESFVLPAFLQEFFNAFQSSGQSINPQQVTSTFQAVAVGAAFATLIFTVVGFFIGAGIYWLIAKAFRGQGRFLQYAYCYLLIHVPLGIITYLLFLIPGVGIILAGALGIYEIVLLILMTMGVHRMSGGKATLAVLILPIVLIILSCIAYAALFAIILNAAHSMQATPSY